MGTLEATLSAWTQAVVVVLPHSVVLAIRGPLSNVNMAGHVSRVLCITLCDHNILGYIMFRKLSL